MQKEKITDMVFASTWDIANIDNNVDYVMLPALTGPTGVRNITRQNNSETSGFDRGQMCTYNQLQKYSTCCCMDRSDVCTTTVSTE